MPFFSFNFTLLRLALGSNPSMVSRKISNRSNFTISMSNVAVSIRVMTSKSSNSPDMRSTFLAAFNKNFRLISGSSMPPSSSVRMNPWMLKMGVLSSCARLPMNSLRNVSVWRKWEISSICESAHAITSRLTCSTMSSPMSRRVCPVLPLNRRMVL